MPHEYYQLLRDRTQHEDELVHQRLTWMITLNGLLFTAYGFSLGAQASWLSTTVTLNLAEVTTPDVPFALVAPKFTEMRSVIDTVRVGMAVVGIGSAVLAAFGVTAANRAIRNDVAAYRAFLEQRQIKEDVPWLERPIGFAATHLLGMAAGSGFPVLVAWVWMYVAGWLVSALCWLGASGLESRPVDSVAAVGGSEP
jgi:hypothetical protein